MNDADKFMQEEFCPSTSTFDAFKHNHNVLFSIVEKFLFGKNNRIGIRLTEKESMIGEYTYYLFEWSSYFSS